MHRNRWRTLCSLLLVLATSAPVTAAVLRVKADASGPAHDGAGWETAYVAVTDALAAAEPGDEVWVAAGQYRSAASLTLREGVSLYGGFNGTESAREERDPAANVSTLCPADTEIPVVVAPAGVTPATVLDGFTITGGHGTERNGAMYGGGVLCEQSAPTISHNRLTMNAVWAGNTTAGIGGGIAVLGGSPVIEANTFAGNAATVYSSGYQDVPGEGGGADIACIGGAALVRNNTFVRQPNLTTSSASRLYLEDTTAFVSGNRMEGQALGIHVRPGAAPTIQENVIQDSVYLAIRCDGDARVTANVLLNTGRMPYPEVPVGMQVSKAAALIEENSITGFGGAGISVVGGTPVITGNTVAGNGSNVTTFRPGGILLGATAAVVRANIVEGNIGAGIVAAGVALDLPDATPTITGNTIRDNIGPAVTAYVPVILTGNEITRNQATGPAVSIQLDSREIRPVTVNGNRIADNTSVGLWVQSSSGNVEVVGNEVLRNTGRAAATVTVWARTVSFAGNRIADNDGPNVTARITIVGPLLPLSQVRNNVIVRNSVKYPDDAGSALYLQGRADIVGNTVADNWLSRGPAIYTRDPNLLANNIVAFNRGGIQVEPNDYQQPTLSHNLAYGNEIGNYLIAPDPTGLDGNLSADPMFVDRAAGDYRLLTGSPAIHAGDDSVTQPDERDVDGNPRIIGPHVDMGALEYVPPDPTIVAEAVRTLRIAAGLDTAMTEDATRLDADASGAVDILDVTQRLRRATGRQ